MKAGLFLYDSEIAELRSHGYTDDDLKRVSDAKMQIKMGEEKRASVAHDVLCRTRPDLMGGKPTTAT